MQLVYISYLSLGQTEEIDIGDVKVWNFDKKASQYIPDEKLKQLVQDIVGSNICNGNPIRDVGIISVGEPEFRVLNPTEMRSVYEASLLLFLSCLSSNCALGNNANAGHFMRTSENFDLVLQNFEPHERHIAEVSGYIVTKRMMGYKIGEKKFHAPSCLLRPLDFRSDQELIQGIIKLRKIAGEAIFNRIVRATDYFRYSYYNSGVNISPHARVLLHIAAFETLLELPEVNPRKYFKEKIEDYCSLPSEKRYTNWYELKSGKEKEQRTIKGIWADKYYTLRNHIVHGDEIHHHKFIFCGSRHLDIATMFFVLLIKKLVNKKLNKEIFYDQIVWNPIVVNGIMKKGFEYQENILRKAYAQGVIEN